jgi:hypothetical protein
VPSVFSVVASDPQSVGLQSGDANSGKDTLQTAGEGEKSEVGAQRPTK